MQQPLRHILPLDGLRGLAILLVISYHYFGFIPVFSIGWIGVDLFFVLSGYLITGRLLDSLASSDYFRTFYRNRILRIFPLYYTVLILFFLGLRFFIKANTRPLIAFYLIHWKSFFLFTENWSFIFFGLPIAPYLLHFWSLAVEEQFYLFWPTLLYFLKNQRRRLQIFTAILLLVPVVRCLYFIDQPHYDNMGWFYYNTFFRIDSFVMGALLCQLHRLKIRFPPLAIGSLFATSVGMLTMGIFILHDLNSYSPFFETIGYSILALFFAISLHHVVAYPRSIIAGLFSSPSIRYIGRISYGLYVLHFPVLEILSKRFQDWGLQHLHISSENGALGFSSGLCLLVTIFFSVISFHYFETPFLKLKRR